MKLLRRSLLFRFGLTLGLLLAAAGGYYLLRYQAWAAYRNWSIARMNGMAREFIAADDSRNALLTVRKVLQKRPNDVEAWRIGVQAALQRESAEAVHFQRNLTRVDRTLENQLELMRLAVKHRLYAVALDTVSAVGAEARDLPEYHRLAAETYRGVGRDLSAKYHLVSLLELEPGDVQAGVALAEIEFETDPEQLPEDWTTRVKRLAEAGGDPAATLLLLRQAAARKAEAETGPLIAALRLRADLTLAQRLELLGAVPDHDTETGGQVLEAAQAQAEERPEDVVEVMAWLTRAGRMDAITAWFPALPEEVRKSEPVRLVAARAFDAGGDWVEVERILGGPAWGKSESLRLALLARSYRMRSRHADFAETWKLALIASGNGVVEMIRLHELVKGWQWPAERIDVLWKLFNLVPTNRTVRDELVAYEYGRGNTVNLNKIYARVVDAAPDDEEARNNFAYTSLLLGTNLTRAHALARDLHRAHPDNVTFLTTYTLSLHLQGNTAEALDTVAQADAAGRASASTALHEAVYAAAAGRLDRAADLLPQIARAYMLPEEREWVKGIRLALVPPRAEAHRASQLAANERPAVGGGWLAWFPDRLAAPTPAQAESNALYREERWAELTPFLRGAGWMENDHLRHALLAFAERSQFRESAAREAWRQATDAAGRDVGRLRELETLAGHWEWTDERIDAMAHRFERDADDDAALAELLEHYRRKGRTSDMARTLWIHVKETKGTGTMAARCVYYSLLSGYNLSTTQILARQSYDAAPAGAPQRVAYAFALLRQERAEEALPLLAGLNETEAGAMQVALVRAAVLLALDRKTDAKNELQRFTAFNALPEEINFASDLGRRAGLADGALTLSKSLSPVTYAP